MKVVIDLGKCKSHGRCYDNGYELFDEGPKGQGVAKQTDISDDDFDWAKYIQEAAEDDEEDYYEDEEDYWNDFLDYGWDEESDEDYESLEWEYENEDEEYEGKWIT